MKKIFVSFCVLFLLSLTSTTLEARKGGTGCEYLSIWCDGGFGSWESYCVNVGGNTNTGCNCGDVYPCATHTLEEAKVEKAEAE